MLEARGREAEELKLPGTRADNMTTRTLKQIVKVYATKFSPTGQMWAAATTEGVMLYSYDAQASFSPIGANITISPQAILEALESKQFENALYMALRLNIAATTTMVLEVIPSHYCKLLSKQKIRTSHTSKNVILQHLNNNIFLNRSSHCSYNAFGRSEAMYATLGIHIGSIQAH